eukprot:405665-Hanusia_phi.AAC.1
MCSTRLSFCFRTYGLPNPFTTRPGTNFLTSTHGPGARGRPRRARATGAARRGPQCRSDAIAYDFQGPSLGAVSGGPSDINMSM